MTPITIRYPLDPSGVASSNMIDGERHALTPNRRWRCIATEYGAFFSDSVVITDLTTGQTLTKEQYFPAELYEQPSDRYGKEIYAILVIVDPEVGTEISVDYQCLGGDYGTSATAIIKMIEKLQLDNRPIEWGDIVNKPHEFAPGMHYHDAGDIYGFEYLVHVLDRIRQAILTGDAASHDVIYSYIDTLEVELRNLIVSNNDSFVTHVNDVSNPHQVTANQLNCYIRTEVDNFIAALNLLLTQHKDDKNNPHQVTAAQLKVYLKTEIDSFLFELEKRLTGIINTHVNDKGNPHNTTAAQLNCYTIQQIDTLLSTLNSGLSTHIADKNNPHATTKAQVELGNVDNFRTAVNADMLAGTSTTLFATPAGVQARVAAHANSGDHDARYVKKGVVEEASITTSGGNAYVCISGTWRQFWPPLWQ